MLPGLCHVGCARMAGQKYLIKNLFGVGEERLGVLPGSPLLCLVPFLFFMLFPCSCTQLYVHRSSGYLFTQGQVTHVDLHNMAMDKATLLLQHSIRVGDVINPIYWRFVFGSLTYSLWEATFLGRFWDFDCKNYKMYWLC